MKAASAHRWLESLEAGSFVLEMPAGTLRQARVNGQPWENPPVQPFFEFLRAAEPAWAALLPPSWDPAVFPLFLPRTLPTDPFPSGYFADLQTWGNTAFVQLVLTLGPGEEARQSSLLEYPRDPAMLAPLFRHYRQSESRLAHYLQNFPGHFFSQKPDLSFSSLSRGVTDWLEIQSQSLFFSGQAFLELIHPQDRQFFLHQIEVRDREQDSFHLKYRLGPLPNGKTIMVQDIRRRLTTPSGLLLGYEGVWMDITHQATVEERLTTVSWKENVSLITSGLAHDFRNIISGIFSLAELVADTSDASSSFQESLLHIKEYSNQALRLVNRIVELNRSEPGPPALHNLQTLLTEQNELLRAYLPRNIRLLTQVPDREVPLFLDKVEFERAFLNLAINSRDALPERGGRIEILVTPVAAGDPLFPGDNPPSHSAPREGVVIEFRDNGSGMSERVKARAFDAFFTTKDANRGSGFGLFSVRQFIEKCGGWAGLQSAPGRGTSVYLFFPFYDFPDTRAGEFQVPHDEDLGPSAFSDRLRLALLSEQSIEHFDFIHCLREAEAEIIAFQDADSLSQFLLETERPPHAVIHFCANFPGDRESFFLRLKVDFPSLRVIRYCLGQPGISCLNSCADGVDHLLQAGGPARQEARQIIDLLR